MGDVVGAPRRVAGMIRRGLRRGVDRALHPGRRERALAGLRERPVPGRVLSLCLGNICRSPYVEAYLREALPGMEIESAGFIGPDRPPPDEALEQARRRGLDTTGHRSKLVTAEAVDAADLVLLVDPAHARRMNGEIPGATGGTPTLVLGDLDPGPVEYRRIADPWGGGEERFTEVFDRLDRCLEVLVREWEGR